MALTIVYGALLVLFIATGVYSLYAGFSTTELAKNLSGGVGLAVAFLHSLSKNSLTVYFWLQRRLIWWHSDALTRWRFDARFDGEFDTDVIRVLVEFLKQPENLKFPVKVDFQGDREAQIEIDGTLVLRLSFESRELSRLRKDHLQITSKTIEVPYGQAKRKINTLIVPILSAAKRCVRPDSDSYELDVDFSGPNPFFAVYIAHLRPRQVGDFRVVLHLDTYVPARAEKVEISRERLHITALSTDSFVHLAEDFILLSPDLKMLAGVRHGA